MDPLVQHTVREAVTSRIGVRQLANVAYGAALSGMEVSLWVMFAVLARAVERRLGEFNAQSLANTAWAFATTDRLDALLFVALARAAERCAGEFNAQSLANTPSMAKKNGKSN